MPLGIGVAVIRIWKAALSHIIHVDILLLTYLIMCASSSTTNPNILSRASGHLGSRSSILLSACVLVQRELLILHFLCMLGPCLSVNVE